MDPKLSSLLSRISDALKRLPGASELYLFGSAADAILNDAYSDLDLNVITDNFLSRSAWLSILEQAGKIRLAYPISETPQESVYTLIFENESPYHKVDLGFCDQQPLLVSKWKNKVLLWQKTSRFEPPPIQAVDAIFPETGTADHFLIGELLSSVRYIKARKRGQHLTCWRFLSAKVNALLRCYLWEGQHSPFPQTSLNTWDFTTLDRKLPEVERLSLLQALSLKSSSGMDMTLIEITQRIVSRLHPQWDTEVTPISTLIHEHLNFIESELHSQWQTNL